MLLQLLRSSMFILLSLMFILPGIDVAFAAHGSSGGSGCSGECEPPTLGTDDQGIVRVENGLKINSNTFNVQGYSQNIPTQIFETGEPNSIQLKIYENTSPEYFSHAEIHFGIHDKYIEGVIVEDSVVSIAWDDEDGEETYAIYGDDNSLSDVNIIHDIDGGLAILDFEFTITKEFEVSTMMIELWDEKRNTGAHYFIDAFQVIDTTPKKPATETTEPISEVVEEKDFSVPSWIKNTAGWWAQDNIGDSDFILGMQHLVDTNVITISQEKLENNTSEAGVPSWIKITAEWWSKGQIGDEDFIRGIEFLLNQNLVNF